MEWRENILKGMKVIPKEGVPGRIVVFGKQAEPILTGTNAEDLLIAAAEFGKGRIVAIAHNSYSVNFAQDNKQPEGATKELHDNLKKWLTRGTFKQNDSIIDAKDDADKEKLKSAKIVLYHGGQVKINPADLTEFVRNGGALFHGETPWGWLQLNKGKILSEAPYAALLSEAGLCYTDEYISVNDTGFSVKDNKASDANLLKVLDEAGKNFNKAIDQVNMLQRLKYLPADVFLQLKKLVEKLFENCKEELKKNTIPSPKKQVNNKKELAILNLWMLCFNLLEPRKIKAPGVDLFPGDFSTQPPLKCHTLEFHSDREDFHSTACYLPAGQTFKVEMLSGNIDKNWYIMVGCHTDDLTNQDKLKRWPKLNKKVRLDQKSLELSTPFGGLIYLISPDKPSQSISVKLENVADSPRFRLTERDKGKETWNQNRHSPGLWADIEGEFIAFTLPSSSVREMEFDALTSVMKTWDSVVRLYHDLRGTDVSKFRRMWIVTDEQPSAGYMHAGYPIVTHMDVADSKGSQFLLNGSILHKEGRWGVFHEIGHNMQRGEWTFEGTGEVTVNIFTLCAMDEICHLKPWIHSWLQNQLKDTDKYLNDGADFKKWKSSAGLALFVYAQLVHEFGWESYRKVFRHYEALPDKDKPKVDQKKIDKWFSTFSETAGFNLAPLASFWNIPLSVEAVADLHKAFPVGFLPDDEVTRLDPGRVDAVLRKYPGTVRKRCSATE